MQLYYHQCDYMHCMLRLLQKRKMEWEAQTGMCQCLSSTFEKSYGCTVLDMPDSKEITEQIDWRAKQPSHVKRAAPRKI